MRHDSAKGSHEVDDRVSDGAGVEAGLAVGSERTESSENMRNSGMRRRVLPPFECINLKYRTSLGEIRHLHNLADAGGAAIDEHIVVVGRGAFELVN